MIRANSGARAHGDQGSHDRRTRRSPFAPRLLPAHSAVLRARNVRISSLVVTERRGAMSLSDDAGVSSRQGQRRAPFGGGDGTFRHARGATGDARPMEERSDAKGPRAATLASDDAQTGA